MKVENLLAAALSVQVGLAIPHGSWNHNHVRNHNKRSLATVYDVVTEIVTVTKLDAIVWVDGAGHPVKTEQKTPATSTPVATTTSSVTTVVTTPSSSSSSKSSTVSTPQVGAQQDNRFGAKLTSPNAAPTSTAKPIKNNNSGGTTHTSGNLAGFGVAYDAFTSSGCRPALDSDFAFLASLGVSMVRVYDACFAQAVNAAAAHNLKLMIGLTTFNIFDSQLNQLISSVTGTSASWSVIDTVFVGNELVNQGAASSAEVAAKVTYARGILRGKGYSGNVITVDTWTQMRNDATICSTSDYCAANAHAYFDGNTVAANAGPFVRNAQKAIAAKNPGKRVAITESGWPHAGASIGVAVASVDNQRAAMGSIIREFSSDSGNMFLFMAYDAKYKSGPEIERNFGIFDSDHYSGPF